MDKNTKNNLIELLNKWFSSHDLSNNRIWQYDDVAILIKNKLKRLNRWKNAPRGDPSKGGRIKSQNKFN